MQNFSKHLTAQNAINYRALERAMAAMNAANVAIKHEGQALLYRLTVLRGDTVWVEAFVPGVEADVEVNARMEFMQGSLWVGARGVVLEDYESKDGCAMELIKTFHAYRDARYERFAVNQPVSAMVYTEFKGRDYLLDVDLEDLATKEHAY